MMKPMSTRFDDLARQARALSVEEKEALVRALIEDLDSAPAGTIERAWVQEARRRYESHLRGEMPALPADQVMARLMDSP